MLCTYIYRKLDILIRLVYSLLWFQKPDTKYNSIKPFVNKNGCIDIRQQWWTGCGEVRRALTMLPLIATRRATFARIYANSLHYSNAILKVLLGHNSYWTNYVFTYTIKIYKKLIIYLCIVTKILQQSLHSSHRGTRHINR